VERHLRETRGTSVTRGDDVTVTGTVIENGGLTELDPVLEMETHSSGNPVPPPEVLDPSVIHESEAYEGVLVRVENVTVVGTTPRTGWSSRTGSAMWAAGAVFVHAAPGRPVARDRRRRLARGPLQDPASRRRGHPAATGVLPDDVPAVLSLSQNLPNPFHTDTGISYTLPMESDVMLRVYGVTGRLVRTLVDGRQPAGYWTVVWDGRTTTVGGLERRLLLLTRGRREDRREDDGAYRVGPAVPVGASREPTRHVGAGGVPRLLTLLPLVALSGCSGVPLWLRLPGRPPFLRRHHSLLGAPVRRAGHRGRRWPLPRVRAMRATSGDGGTPSGSASPS